MRQTARGQPDYSARGAGLSEAEVPLHGRCRARARRAAGPSRRALDPAAPNPGILLLATWNIANLGAKEQPRDPACFELLPEVVQSFDLVVAQEVRDNVSAARQLLAELPSSWQLLFSEAGGNDERFAFFWDRDVVDWVSSSARLLSSPRSFQPPAERAFRASAARPTSGPSTAVSALGGRQ